MAEDRTPLLFSALPEESLFRSVVVVVPCHNEADRLAPPRFLEAVRLRPNLRLLFVNDGSVDDTASLLARIARAEPSRVSVLELPHNRGKAEAVRLGMLAALDSEPEVAGYWDADLATPLSALGDFLRVLEEHPDLEVILGSRVRLLGRRIARRATRHYPGRVLATFASLTLDLPVYDTQCGSKLFRVTPALRDAFVEPFLSRWVFDVELLARLLERKVLERGANMYELSLREWTDVAGSQVRPIDFLIACRDLVLVRRRYHRGGAGRQGNDG